MMRSMYSAVSGLRIHQSKMDTIGNNIANVNTVGFKKGQVTFQEVFSQVVRGASAPTTGKGGTNPQQIGMGAATGSINTIHTKGPGQRTDNPTDLMIDGEGFFVVSDDSNFSNRYYTRAGNFSLDRDGNLTTADGMKVLGYGANDGKIDTSNITGIRINMSETKAPTATENIVFRGNLDSRVADGTEQKVDTVITDSLGNSYTVTFNLVKQTTDHTWNMTVDRVTDRSTGNYIATPAGLMTTEPSVIAFDSKGDIATIDGSDVTTGFDLKIQASVLDGIVFDTDKEGDPLTATTSPGGAFKDITIFDSTNQDTFKELSQYANEMGIKPYAQDGNNSGSLEGFAIDATGTVIGVFTNGERKALGQIMLAKFDNPMGLQKLGSNMFVDTRNSGEAQYGGASVGGFGAISPGNLEMSNVDISLEFTEMITTQRGFQANSRVITTSDEMLQELVNMKR